MKIKQVTASAFLSIASSAFGGTYLAEIESSLAVGEQEVFNSDHDLFIYSISGQIFFRPVDTSKGPLLIAPFLDKASGVTLNYQATEWEPQEDNLLTRSFENESYTAGVGFVTPNNFILSGGHSRNETTGDRIIDNEENTLFLGIGAYLGDKHSVNFFYTNEEQTIRTRTSEETRYSLRTLSFHPTGGETGIALDATYSHIDDENETGFELGAQTLYFFNRQLNIGFTYEIEKIGSEENSILSLNTNLFFSQHISGEVHYSAFDLEDNDAKLLIFSLSARF